MQMTPCRTCPFKGACDVREAKRTALRGLGLSAIKFRCEKLLESFRPGVRVLAKLDYVAVGLHRGIEECDSWKTEKRTVEAYVMKFTSSKVRIFVPYDEAPVKDGLPEWWLQKLNGGEHGYGCVHVLRVSPERLEATGETVPACSNCGMPEPFDTPEGWSCRTYMEDHGMGYVEQVQAECDFRSLK